MGGFGTAVKESAIFARLALLLLVATLVFAPAVSAYSVQFSKGVKNEDALRQYLADYDQSRLDGIAVVSFSSSLGHVKGLFLIGGQNRNRIIISSEDAWDRWHFNAILNHETAHSICWRRENDVSHKSNCFKEEGITGQ